MSDVTQKESLEAIINHQSKDSKKVTQSQITDIKQRVSKNSKRIKKLSQKTKKPHKKSNGFESIANIECRNRFAVLQNNPQSSYVRTNNSTSDSAVSTTKNQKYAHWHRTEHRKIKPKPVSVKFIGASMVRGQGRLLNDTKQGVSACCYPDPGFTAEQIRDCLPGTISKHDDIVLLLGGTNNGPRVTVATCITEINSLIEDTKTLNKRAHIIVSEIPLRFDDISLNQKIEKINMFIRHKCTKSARLHVVNHGSMFMSDFARDGLHLSAAGKAKFADATQRLMRSITK